MFWSYLHGDICGASGMTLQILITTASGTPHQGHTRGTVDVLHLCWVFLNHLYQLFNGPAEATTPHFLKHQYCKLECKDEPRCVLYETTFVL